MRKRGPKRAPLSSSGLGLPPTPPAELGLSGESAKAYEAIAQRMISLGLGTVGDARSVALAASSAATLKRLEAEMAAIPSLTVLGSHGPRTHPILSEVRSERKILSVMLDRLLLNPKARKTSRVKDEPAGRAANPADDSLEDLLG